MRLLNFTIIKLTFFLIVGIIVGYITPINISTSSIIFAVTFIALSICYFTAKNTFKKTIWFGVFSFITVLFLGVLVTNFHNHKNKSNNYTHTITTNETTPSTITFRVREVLKPGNYYDKYIIDLLNIDSTHVSGKTLLNIEKDSTISTLKVDDVLITKATFKNLISPLNPNQFNYKTYLKKQYIYHQIFIKNKALLKVSSKPHTLLGYANRLRSFINNKLKTYNFSINELAIINALFLGQRQNIDRAIYTNYTNAGAIHILAVSGLHVGIIFLILNFLFKPIERLKKGYLIKTIFLLTTLWGFAVIAGLSASVTRAVTMFSIVAIAVNLKRPTNVYNTLAISIFVILLFKPLFIFDVGFQLSFLAVFAIVAIEPMLNKLWKPKNKLLKIYWQTLTVTISAQFGIIPISLFYFHQFPGLFFISNLVIIPLLGFILGFGILIILLASINVLPQFLADAFGFIIYLMNSFVAWVAQQEAFIFKNISFSLLYVFTSYIFIICIVKLAAKTHFKAILWALLSVVILQLSFLYTKHTLPKNEFIVFHKSRYSLLANITDNKIFVSNDFDSITKVNTKIIKDFTVGNHIKNVKYVPLKNIYFLNRKSLLIVDSLGIYNVKTLKPDYVLLRQSPKINLNRLIDSLKPTQIIADGSNYKSYIEHWERVCKKRKLPFHQTSKKGAFIIKY
ncbi:ComEC family competence protein [Seonamhaeicola algicola]|uniref:ComEC family competence protein n=2 Tax=Seonamhaeicola TaxID=1649495 RepID=A0A5C7AH85_9FLAO|nr:ComEC/Rec2 family competence protein [Seonamhaeicola algicola]TXE07269.1 ComEC family competence protein [Seonamhaeicola algicola]